MLNVAICLSGHINTFHRKKVHEPILKIIKDLNADVYVCTSTMMSSPQKHKPTNAEKLGFKKIYIPPRPGRETPHHYGWGLQADPGSIATYVKQKLGSSLSEIKVIDQNIERINNDLPSCLWEYQRQSELLKLKECFNMIEEAECARGRKYDAVIRCRPDICLQNPKQSEVISRFLKNISKNKDNCIVNLGGWPCSKSHNLRSFFYGFCYGNRDSMKKLANIIEVEDIKIYEDQITAMGETLTTGSFLEAIVSHYIGNNNIKIGYECNKDKRSRKYTIVRSLPIPTKLF